jgi:glycosyltransferase involved in cell wall biosynthesis
VQSTVHDSGLLVDVRDPIKIANSVILLLTNRELRKILGVNGSERLGKEFSGEKIAGQYVELYETILFGDG